MEGAASGESACVYVPVLQLHRARCVFFLQRLSSKEMGYYVCRPSTFNRPYVVTKSLKYNKSFRSSLSSYSKFQTAFIFLTFPEYWTKVSLTLTL
jgi:hypothetical protein